MTLIRSSPGGRLPRVRPAPEQGVIQAPEITRQLQQRLGVRGMHVTPTLEPTVQPVVVVEDLRTVAPLLQVPYAAWARVVGDGLIAFQFITLFNLAGSQRRMRVRKVWVEPAQSGIQDVMNIAVGFASGISSPQAVKVGIPQHVVQFPTVDLPPNDLRQTQTTAAGRLLPYLSGTATGNTTFFEQRAFGHAGVGTTDENHRQIFIFEPPELWIYPNSGVTFYFDGPPNDLIFDLSASWYEERFL